MLINYFIDLIYLWLNFYLEEWYECYESDEFVDILFRNVTYSVLALTICVRYYTHQHLVMTFHIAAYLYTALTIYLMFIVLDMQNYIYTINIMYFNYLICLYWDKCGKYITWWSYYYVFLTLDFLLELTILYFVLCLYTVLKAIYWLFIFYCWLYRNFFYYTIKYIYKPLRPYIIFEYK